MTSTRAALIALGGALACGEPDPLTVAPPAPAPPYTRRTGSVTAWTEAGKLSAGDTSRFAEAIATTPSSIYVAQGDDSDPRLFAFDRDAAWTFRASFDASPYAPRIASVAATEADVWLGLGGRIARLSPTLEGLSFLEAPEAGEELGFSMDADDGWLAVGDPGHDARRGRVLLYRTGAASAPVELIPPGLGAGARFGWSVALNGGRLLVGAPSNGVLAGARPCDRASCLGAAYLYGYRVEAWALDSELAPPGPDAQAFGAAVAWLDDRPVVSAPLAHACLPEGSTCRGTRAAMTGAPCAPNEVVCPYNGQVYVRAPGASGWKSLLPPSDLQGRKRGEAIDAGGGWVAAGSRSDPGLDTRYGNGTVHLVAPLDPTQEDLVLVSDWFVPGLQFGTSVAFDVDGRLYVGAPQRCGTNVDASCRGRGAVLVYAPPAAD